jgi:hypothetical protein
MSILTTTPAHVLPLATVPARDLKPGDLIGGSAGEWLTVTNVYVDPNVKHLVADVDVAPIAFPERGRTWQIDASAKMAILRPGHGA